MIKNLSDYKRSDAVLEKCRGVLGDMGETASCKSYLDRLKKEGLSPTAGWFYSDYRAVFGKSARYRQTKPVVPAADTLTDSIFQEAREIELFCNGHGGMDRVWEILSMMRAFAKHPPITPKVPNAADSPATDLGDER